MAELQVSGLIHVFQKDPPLLDLFLPLLRFRRRVLWPLLRRRLLVLLRPPFFFLFLFLRFLVFPLPGGRVLAGTSGASSTATGAPSSDKVAFCPAGAGAAGAGAGAATGAGTCATTGACLAAANISSCCLSSFRVA